MQTEVRYESNRRADVKRKEYIMKKTRKIISIFAMAVFATTAFAQQKGQPEIETKEEREASVSEEMASIQTAFQLAEYGYKTNSASSLLCAAEILAQVPTQEMTTKATQDESESKDTNSEKKEYTASQLLEDGKKLAGKDKTLLAYAKSVEKLVKKGGTRGAFGGPKYDYSYVYGGGKTSYYNVGFVAGRYAEIEVYSDGADLDLYVYDSNWNLIDRDNSYSPNAWCSFVPRWDGNFHIVIKNNSRYSSWYQLYTN